MAYTREELLAAKERLASQNATPQQTQAAQPQMQQAAQGQVASQVNGFMSPLNPETLRKAGQEVGHFGIGAAQEALRNPLLGGALGEQSAPIMRQILGLGAPDTAENVGAGTVKAGLFALGGMGLNGLRAGAEAIPYAGQIAKYLGQSNIIPTALRQGAGTGIYDAIEHPENAGTSFAKGFGIGAPLGAAGAYINRASAPVREMEKITKDIPKQAHQYKKEAQTIYNDIDENFSELPMYGKAKFKGFQGMEDILASPRVKYAYDKYSEVPNLGSALKLRSQLGKTQKRLENYPVLNNKDIAELDQAKALQKKIDSQIAKTLEKASPGAEKDLLEANSLYGKAKTYQDLSNKVRNAVQKPENIASTIERFGRKQSHDFEGEVIQKAPERALQQAASLGKTIDKYKDKQERGRLFRHGLGAALGAGVGGIFDESTAGAVAGTVLPLPKRLLGGGGKTGAIGNLVRQALLANLLAGDR